MAMIEELWLPIKTSLDDAGFRQLERQTKRVQEGNAQILESSRRIAAVQGTYLKDTIRDVKTASKELKTFRFEWLGVMFAGMAMQRMFSGLLRASFATWSKITEGTSEAGGAIGQLSAAWEFFKYSLFDALLNSGLFQSFVDVVLRLVEWWGTLSEDTRSMVANFVIIGLVLGSVLFIAGQIAMALNSISLLLVGQNFSINAIKIGFSSLVTFINGSLIPAMSGAFAVAGPILLVAAILLAIGYVVWLARETKSLGSAFQNVIAEIIRAWAGMSQMLMDLFSVSFDWFIDRMYGLLDVVLRVVSALDYTFGTKFSGQVMNAMNALTMLQNANSSVRDAQLITTMAEGFINKYLPSASAENDLSFNDYISGVAQAVTQGIQNAAPQLGAEIGKGVVNNSERARVPSQVGQANQLIEMQRTGYGYLLQ